MRMRTAVLLGWIATIHALGALSPSLAIAQSDHIQAAREAYGRRLDRYDGVRVEFSSGTIIAQGMYGESGGVSRPPEGAISKSSYSMLVHGDFDGRHLIVDEDGLVTGVIDWGDIHLGNPAVDLAIAHTFFPAPVRAAFLSAYGPIPDDTWCAARFRAVHNTLHVLDWAVQTGKVATQRSARLWLRHIAVG